jgi:3-phosphoshikimate 1-carboxyvinyltransferase
MAMISLQLDSSRLFDEISVQLPSSKSISNRLLIIHKIANSNVSIKNLSDADDTRILNQLLESDAKEVNCGLGGTAIRFFLAYCYLINREVIVSGEEPLNKRPINPLVDALRHLGAQIVYLNKENYPPVHLKSTAKENNQVVFDENISSQFVSALLLIAPYLPNGLSIQLPLNQVSFSYINMTMALMRMNGVAVDVHENKIIVPQQKYKPIVYRVSADWSAAIYWIGLIAIAGKGKVLLNDLKIENLQGDEALLNWLKNFGVTYSLTEDGIIFEKYEVGLVADLNLDLSDNPDLAQPLAVIAAALGIKASFTGLSTLKHKESNRILAIATELNKAGADVIGTDDCIEIRGRVNKELLKEITFDTYHDHRMAMSLAMLAALGERVSLNNPEVVSKSYPTFFNELEKFCKITY